MGAFWEETLSAAEDNRVDHEPVFIDESMLHQRSYQPAAAYDRDDAPGLLLEFSHFLRNVSFDHGRVVPFGLPECSRNDVLGHAVQLVGDSELVIGAGGPGGGEDVISGSPEEYGIGFENLRLDEFRDIVGKVGKLPLLGGFHDAI